MAAAPEMMRLRRCSDEVTDRADCVKVARGFSAESWMCARKYAAEVLEFPIAMLTFANIFGIAISCPEPTGLLTIREKIFNCGDTDSSTTAS